MNILFLCLLAVSVISFSLGVAFGITWEWGKQQRHWCSEIDDLLMGEIDRDRSSPV